MVRDAKQAPDFEAAGMEVAIGDLRDHDAIASAVARLLADPDRARDLGRRGVRARPCRRRVARYHVGDHKRQDDDARDHQHGQGDPACDVNDQPVGLRSCTKTTPA